MKKNYTACLLIIISLFFVSCAPQTQPAYFLSPMDVNANYYHAIPLKSDSLKSAIYTNAVFTVGSSNKLEDYLYAFHGGIYRAHNFGIFQAYYGAGLGFGSYHASEYYRIKYRGGGLFGGALSSDTLYHQPKSVKGLANMDLTAALIS